MTNLKLKMKRISTGLTLRSFLNLHQNIVKRRTTTEVSQHLRSNVIGIAAVARQLLPPDRKRYHHTGPRFIRHPRLESEFASIVVNANPIAVIYLADGGINRMNVQERLLFRLHEAW